MKKSLSAIAVVLSVASMSMAQTTNTIPYGEDFESYAVGSNLVGSVWQGDTNESSGAKAIVTNLTYTPSAGYPLTNSAHSKVMAFSDGTITNELDGTSLTVVAIDTMIRPVFSEPPTGAQLESVSNSQVSLYFATNGYVTVFNGIQNNTLPVNPNDGWEWTALTNTTPVTTGEWVRLTVVMNYDSVINGPISMYKVAINGSFINSPNAYLTPDVSASKGGPWFVSPKWDDGDLRMHRISLAGSGMLDDFVVTTNEIAYTPPEEPTYATNGTEIAWMIASGLSTNSTNTTWDLVALDDQDGDGAPTWAEFYAATHPTNEYSRLAIISAVYSNGIPTIKWLSTSNAANPYIIQWSSNLMNILAWTTVTNNIERVEGTNTVTLPAPPGSPAFLRVNVTTNAP